MRGFSPAVFEKRMSAPRGNPYQPLSRERPFGVVEPDDELRFAGSVVRVQKRPRQPVHVGVVTRVLNRGKLIEVQVGFRGGIPATFRYDGDEVLAIIDLIDAKPYIARAIAGRVGGDKGRPIARTAKHVLQRIAKSGRECKVFTLENQFHGETCHNGVQGVLSNWLGTGRKFGHLRYKGNGKYVLDYHSNRWIEFTADPP